MRVTESEYQAMVSRNTPNVKPARNKFGAVKTTVDGIVFDSKHEAECWTQLRLREQAGEIRDLRRQGKFPLMVDGHFIGFYVSDFDYYDVRLETRIVADAKSEHTKTLALYRWKKKHFAAQFGFEIVEL